MFNPMEVVESVVVRLTADTSRFMAGMTAAETRWATFVRNTKSIATAVRDSTVSVFNGAVGAISHLASGAITQATRIAESVRRKVVSAFNDPIAMKFLPPAVPKMPSILSGADTTNLTDKLRVFFSSATEMAKKFGRSFASAMSIQSFIAPVAAQQVVANLTGGASAASVVTATLSSSVVNDTVKQVMRRVQARGPGGKFVKGFVEIPVVAQVVPVVVPPTAATPIPIPPTVTKPPIPPKMKKVKVPVIQPVDLIPKVVVSSISVPNIPATIVSAIPTPVLPKGRRKKVVFVQPIDIVSQVVVTSVSVPTVPFVDVSSFVPPVVPLKKLPAIRGAGGKIISPKLMPVMPPAPTVVSQPSLRVPTPPVVITPPMPRIPTTIVTSPVAQGTPITITRPIPIPVAARQVPITPVLQPAGISSFRTSLRSMFQGLGKSFDLILSSAFSDSTMEGIRNRISGIFKGSAATGIQAKMASLFGGTAFTKMREFNDKYNQFLQDRYGRVGMAIKYGGVAAGYGVTGVSAMMGTPLWIPGSSILGSLPLVIGAELIKGGYLISTSGKGFVNRLKSFWASFDSVASTLVSGITGTKMTGVTYQLGRTIRDGLQSMYGSVASSVASIPFGQMMAPVISRIRTVTSSLDRAFSLMLSGVMGRPVSLSAMFSGLSLSGLRTQIAAMFSGLSFSGLGRSVINAIPFGAIAGGLTAAFNMIPFGAIRTGIVTAFNAIPFAAIGNRLMQGARIAGTGLRAMFGGMTGGPPPTPPTPPAGGFGSADWFSYQYVRASHKIGQAFGAAFSIPGKLLRGVHTVISTIHDSISSMVLGFRRLGWVLGLPSGLINIAALRSFTQLDQAVTQAVAVMSGYDANIRRSMEELAMNISSRSITPSAELGKGLYTLISAGMTAAQAMAALADVEKFAVAGLMSVDRAAEMLTSTQMALGMSADNAGQNLLNMQRVMDVVTKAAVMSNATVSSMTESFTHKGAAGLSFVNKTIEEGAAMLAVYATRGITGALAGERMAIMLRDLQTASVRNKDVWEQYGISVFHTSGAMRGAMRLVADIIQQMEERMEGLNDEQRTALFLALRIPDRSRHALLPFIGQSEQLRGYLAALQGAAGTVPRMYGVMLTSFAAQLKILWNQISAVGVGIGRVLVPWLQRMNEVVQRGIAWWRELPSALKETIVLFGGLMLVATPLMWLFGSLFNFAWNVLANPLTSLGQFAIIGTALAGLARFIGSAGGLSGAWKIAKDNMGEFFEKAFGFMVNFQHNFDVIIAWFGRNWGNMLKGALDAAVTFVMETISSIVSNLGPIGMFIVRNLVTAFEFVGNVLIRIFTKIAEIIGNKIGELGTRLRDTLLGVEVAAQMTPQTRLISDALIARVGPYPTTQHPEARTPLVDVQRNWMQQRGMILNQLTTALGPTPGLWHGEEILRPGATSPLPQRDWTALGLPGWLRVSELRQVMESFRLATGQPLPVQPQDRFGVGAIIQEELGRTRFEGSMGEVARIFRESIKAFGVNVEALTGLRFDIPRTPLTRDSFFAANVAGLIGQATSSSLGGPMGALATTMSRGMFFRVPTMPEQAQNAAGIVGAIASPLTDMMNPLASSINGLVRIGTATFDLSHAGGRPPGATRYDEQEAPEVTSRGVAQFEQISLRRFVLEGTGGLASLPPKTQQVSDPGSHRRFDDLIGILRPIAGQMGTSPRPGVDAPRTPNAPNGPPTLPRN